MRGMLPARHVIAEHYRLGSSMAILSRSFCDITKETSIEQIAIKFRNGMRDIRNYEGVIKSKDASFYSYNCEFVNRMVHQITRA